jgi:hypothetical protein
MQMQEHDTTNGQYKAILRAIGRHQDAKYIRGLQKPITKSVSIMPFNKCRIESGLRSGSKAYCHRDAIITNRSFMRTYLPKRGSKDN